MARTVASTSAEASRVEKAAKFLREIAGADIEADCHGTELEPIWCDFDDGPRVH
jgi:hypothetical protein